MPSVTLESAPPAEQQTEDYEPPDYDAVFFRQITDGIKLKLSDILYEDVSDCRGIDGPVRYLKERMYRRVWKMLPKSYRDEIWHYVEEIRMQVCMDS
ncbi:hypothetical protein KKF55_01265 [Patescibacteria group bacterium]|nr:hypothetical protein [Patescibacteria group bacterium]